MGIFIFMMIMSIAAAAVFLAIFDKEGPFIGIVILGLVFCFGILMPYSLHNMDLTRIEHSLEIVQIQEDYREGLKEQLNTLPELNGSLMNEDSPYRSIISQIAASEGRIAAANENVLDSKMSIERRERGLTSYILWFF